MEMNAVTLADSRLISFLQVQEGHLEVLAEILNYYVVNSVVTFHKATLSAEDMREKVFFSNPVYGSYIINCEEDIAGYCTLMPWKKQEAYRRTAEVAMYLKPEFTAKGIGKIALDYLEQYAKQNQVETLIAGVCTENTSSIKLFEKCGFVQCAHFRQVGEKFGRLLDTVYLQKHF